MRMDGIYRIAFRGRSDFGMGMLVLRDGVVTGADEGGVLYDGTYVERLGTVEMRLQLTVPPGTQLVQGLPPQQVQFTFPIEFSVLERAFHDGSTIKLQTQYGPINVVISKLRDVA